MNRSELEPVVDAVSGAVRDYLADLPRTPAGATAPEQPARTPLPEAGDGALAAFRELVRRTEGGATGSAGPRFFHFVTGGVTPAALAADMWASAVDQNAFSWASSPLATRLEVEAIGWLLQLFELPDTWDGVFTTGATMANFAALGAARQWWGEEHGVDVAADGFSGLPVVPVYSSGYIHISAVKALSALGMGRSPVRRFSRDGTGRLDVDGLEAALRGLSGAPVIIVANAGEVNAGDFDPIDRMVDLAERHNAWVHVDGAFGLFARVSRRARPLSAGIEGADSVIADGHKWLNVPYDCGFAFVARSELLARLFASGAPYLPDPDDPHPTPGYLSPEMSRRARSLAVWTTLKAYGRSGYAEMVDGHLAYARRLAEAVRTASRFELLAEPVLNIVCFRYNPGTLDADELDRANERLARAIVADGRVMAGATIYDGKVALRPAFVNWSTSGDDIDTFFSVVDELADGLSHSTGSADR